MSSSSTFLVIWFPLRQWPWLSSGRCHLCFIIDSSISTRQLLFFSTTQALFKHHIQRRLCSWRISQLIGLSSFLSDAPLIHLTTCTCVFFLRTMSFCIHCSHSMSHSVLLTHVAYTTPSFSFVYSLVLVELTVTPFLHTTHGHCPELSVSLQPSPLCH